MNEQNYSIKPNLFMIALALFIALLIPFQVDGREVADGLGARFVPYLGCAIVFVPNVIQLISRLLRRSRVKEKIKEDRAKTAVQKTTAKERLAGFLTAYGKLIIILAMIFAATFAVEKLGYIFTYCLLCGGMLLVFREKRWYFYLISFVLVILVYIGFTKFLYVPLPTLR